jgi:hypothetical protein
LLFYLDIIMSLLLQNNNIMVLLNENNRIQSMVEIFGSAHGTGGTTA